MGKSPHNMPGWVKGVIGLVLAGLGIIVIWFLMSPGPPSAVPTPDPFKTATMPTASVLPTETSPPIPTVTPTAAAVPAISPIQTPKAAAISQGEVGSGNTSPTPTRGDPVPVYTYNIINTFPHDRQSFTQGLIFEDGLLYEGSGRYGQSSIRKVSLETGQVTQISRLPEQFWGEGITIFGDDLFQLTWKSRTGFIYDKTSFELKQMFSYPTEGWGLTHDGERLIMSDGTANLYFLNPETLGLIDHIQVNDNEGPVMLLNELEYIGGEVYANIWRTNQIARIDPQSGQVVGWIDLSGLLSAEDRREPVDVLNGIAYDATQDRLFVTGKLWPKLFEIELRPEKP